jgi:predicted RNA-binding protein with RPS1 domain
MSKDSFASLMEGSAGAPDRARKRLRPGENLEATVVHIGAEFVFVDVGTPIEARIPRGELSDETGKPRVAVGDHVRATVVEAAHDGTLLRSLGLSSPPQEAPKPDEVLAAKVTRVEKFGVFVKTPKGDGLVPARELGVPPNADLHKAFPIGKELDVVVMDVNDAGKVRFSATRVSQVEEAKNFREFAEGRARVENNSPAPAAKGAPPPRAPAALGSLGDLLREKFNLPEPPKQAAPTKSAAVEPRPPVATSAPVARPTAAPPPAKSAEPPATMSELAGRRDRPRRDMPDSIVRRKR